MNHYFRMCFVCEPGGSRKTEYHVLGTLDEVKAAVLSDLNDPVGAYHALFYGEDIILQCWEGGRLVAAIDLHPYIRYAMSGHEGPIAFPGKGNEPVFDIFAEPQDGNALLERVLDGRVSVEATVDWDAVPIPDLAGAPLPAESHAKFNDEAWEYGLHGDWDSYDVDIHQVPAA